MMDLEKILKEKKREYEGIEAPKELEDRLRNALEKHKPQKKSLWRSNLIAVALIFFVFVGYHFNTFAYFGKKIIGYDNIMSQSLQDLNQMGNGQEIGKNYVFKNGIEIILDGIMIDDNQMLAFYRIIDPNNELHDYITYESFEGFLRNYRMWSGVGEYLDDNQQEIVYIGSFETPWMLERTLTFEYELRKEDYQEKASISFVLDRNKAMGHSIKQKLDSKVEVEGIEVHFGKITATPTQTVIEGRIDNLLEFISQQFSGDQIRIPNINIKLLADGKEINSQGSGITTNMKGINFDVSFDPLPRNIEKLEIQLENISVMGRPNISIDILQKELPHRVEYRNKKIYIEAVDIVNDETHIIVETEKYMSLLDVDLIADEKDLKFIETQSLSYEKRLDGITNHRRKIIFQGEGENLQLKIGTIVYTAEFEGDNITIEVK